MAGTRHSSGASSRVLVGVKSFASDAGRLVLMRGMKPLCARNARYFHLAPYGMDSSMPRSRQTFMDKVRRTITAIG